MSPIAARRIQYEDVRPIPSLNIPELIELDCVRPVGDTLNLLFHCEPIAKYRGVCLKCNKSHRHYSKGYARDRLVHDISMGLIHVDIMVKTPRYSCEDCGKSFSHPFTSLMPGQQFTRRLYEQIKVRALNGPFTELAKEYGVAVSTISEILVEYAKELEAGRKVIAPRVLGIDEKHIVQEKRGVLVDIERGVLLEMTRDNSTAAVKAAIESLTDYDKNIKIVCIDMWNPYVAVVQECLPNAVIVVDRFHVIQNLYRKIEQTRKALFAHLKATVKALPDGNDKERKIELLTKLGKNVYLFKFGREKLTEKQDRSSLMAELCLEFPELNTLRLLKEGLERIYESETRKEAEARYAAWDKLVPPKDELYSAMHTLQRTMKNWKKHIFSYFDDGCNFTNATTEGVNSLIGHLNNEGRGYKFETLRIKSLFYANAADKPEYVRGNKKTYDFKSKQPIMQDYTESPFGRGDILEELLNRVQVSGGGAIISKLVADIKTIL